MVTSLRFRQERDGAGGFKGIGWAVDAVSDTITGTNVPAADVDDSSTRQSFLRQRKSWLTWMPAARAISEAPPLVQGRLQPTVPYLRETSAGAARQT
ncbi:hypothetical protein [Rhizobium laguerreae]|uniref:hypothetical protein n=1 Tax=Rhizobium laguerreae TaxID=1076926 RepID=UPI001C90AA2A|nr:hypothetical protein [Rhizobium laguerreae]MBY3346447.1 hypothetical protein [Rhizobium laguerreae]MBY3353408.1 hypothetical protein [Rhizobium laguerreae]MBY3374454.1 hypothetical protein [Rhizobium laguerreae]MBY3387290.1 hypothetical protein [Rhizobium laguerreae]MBY3401040.1 hypothetical protein [Rhizobium laguerreae]